LQRSAGSDPVALICEAFDGADYGDPAERGGAAVGEADGGRDELRENGSCARAARLIEAGMLTSLRDESMAPEHAITKNPPLAPPYKRIMHLPACVLEWF